MKKIISLILILCMIGCPLACVNPDVEQEYTDNDGITGGDGQTNSTEIVSPQYKDYGRDSVNFNEIIYSRPDIPAVITAFNTATLAVTENSKAPNEQISDIIALEDAFKNTQTMYSLAEIYQSKDTSSEFWNGEREYMSVHYPKLSQAAENLLVACAKSEHKPLFESECFGYSLDEYTDGGIYTDEIVNLMQAEASLEAKYSSLSETTVEIEYKSVASEQVFKGTVNEVKEMLREHFATDDKKYNGALILVNQLYDQKLKELKLPLFVELIKVRRLIADELGYSSYRKFAYAEMGYDYTEADMLGLLEDVGKYVSPVAKELEYSVFYNYFRSNYQPTLDRVTLINTLYEVYSEIGGDYSDAYSYMLQHGLYDVAKSGHNRYAGAFATYLENNSSPYLFVTTSGLIKDYTTFSHEFGHFLDGYVNLGAEDSLTMMEISSQALELLTVLSLNGALSTPDYQYLEYLTIFTFINNVIMRQSLYSAFEHIAYSLSYDEITEDSLSDALNSAFSLIYGDDVPCSFKLSDVIIPHTVLYPFYVESYVTAAFVSLDIFFAESDRTGASGEGFKLYEALINRDGEPLSFSERLERAGIASPFANGQVQSTANNIYYYIMGKNYVASRENVSKAA